MKSTRYIKYSEPNDEPEEHWKGKMLVNHLVGRWGYISISNTDKFEFKLPTIHTELDGDKDYQLDVLMYNPISKRLIAVEVNGAYHFTNKKRIARTKQKHELILGFLESQKFIECDGDKYYYDKFKLEAFKTEDLIGKYAMPDDYITNVLCIIGW